MTRWLVILALLFGTLAPSSAAAAPVREQSILLNDVPDLREAIVAINRSKGLPDDAPHTLGLRGDSDTGPRPDGCDRYDGEFDYRILHVTEATWHFKWSYCHNAHTRIVRSIAYWGSTFNVNFWGHMDGISWGGFIDPPSHHVTPYAGGIAYMAWAQVSLDVCPPRLICTHYYPWQHWLMRWSGNVHIDIGGV